MTIVHQQVYATLRRVPRKPLDLPIDRETFSRLGDASVLIAAASRFEPVPFGRAAEVELARSRGADLLAEMAKQAGDDPSAATHLHILALCRLSGCPPRMAATLIWSNVIQDFFDKPHELVEDSGRCGMSPERFLEYYHSVVVDAYLRASSELIT